MPTADAVSDLCFTAREGRARFEERLAITGSDANALRKQLDRFVEGGRLATGAKGTHRAGARTKVAFLFTGQGAQYAGMGRELYSDEPVFRAALDRCDKILQPLIGASIVEIMQADSDERLDQTAFTQPALFSIEFALCELWKSWGVTPDFVMGHSVGEYAAVTIAGLLSLEDGLKLIAERGRLMQELPSGGVMAAVMADVSTVEDAIAAHSDKVSIAALNGPRNTVISGAGASVDQILAALEAEGVTAKRLVVSHAFHSPLMEPMLDAYEHFAAGLTFGTPTLPIISNVSGALANPADLSDPSYWRRHVREAVQFDPAMKALEAAGVDAYVEVGPHPTLIGMARSCVDDGQASWIPSLRRKKPESAQLMQAVGELFVRGVVVDPEGFDGEHRLGSRVEAPTYPFQYQECWVQDDAGKHQAAGGSVCRHPLLGVRLRSAAKQSQIESELSAEPGSMLADHLVFESPVFPATGMLEMVVAAAEELYGKSAIRLEDVGIQAAMVLSSPRRAQILLTPAKQRRGEFEVYSCGADSDADAEWQLHATGQFVLEGAAAAAVDGDPRQWSADTSLSPMTGDAFYAMTSSRGIEYGPTFRGVEKVWRKEGLALGRCRVPDSLRDDLGGYHWHPALLDAGLQVMFATLAEDSPTYLPIRMGSVSYHRPLPEQFWSKVSIETPDSSNAETIRGEIRIVDDAGHLLVHVADVQLKRASAAMLRRGGDVDDLLYELAWDVKPLTQRYEVGTEPDFLPSAAELAGSLTRQLPDIEAEFGLDFYARWEPKIDRLVGMYVENALLELGWSYAPGDTIELDSVASALGVVPDHLRMLEHGLRLLAEDGLLKGPDLASRDVVGGWEVLREFQQNSVAELARDIDAEFPEAAAELRITSRCGDELGAVLAGRQDPLQLLFPDGSLKDLEELYTRAPFTKAYNSLVRNAVREALKDRPADRPLRVLEVGAGTGGTATWVLPILPADATEYHYTDMSNLFNAKAKQRFKEFDFIDYRILDIDQDPMKQGFEPSHYDLVLATNVLHATKDVRATLRRVRDMMAPEGMLFMVEGLGPQRWVDLIFGLTEGWWRSQDVDLRPHHPLFGIPTWKTVLREIGFEDPQSIPGEDAPARLNHQGVFMARGPKRNARNSQGPKRTWITLADSTGVSDRLCDRLTTRGDRCVKVFVGDQFKQDGDRYTVDPLRADHLKRVVEAVLASDDRLVGVIHAWPLEDPVGQDSDVETLRDAQSVAYGGALHAVQALVGMEPDCIPGMWILTRGSQTLLDSEPGGGVAQSLLWGLGHVIGLEHPELRCRRLDLDPSRGLDHSDVIESIANEILFDGNEDQVAWRGGQRWVGRLQLRPTGESIQGCRLEISERGRFDALTWKPYTSATPGADEVQIEIEATGLNFKDVLNALGQYPGDPGPLGLEVAGRVIAVGAEVHHVAVGDSVLAISKGGFAETTIAPGAFVAKRPASLDAAESATIPVAFLTAYYALEHVAGLSEGQRVLIHAGAGGVGMAAIQLALRAGCEVFATAGNPAKRDAVRSLGVKHVFDSRSLEFMTQVRDAANGAGMDRVLNCLAGDFIGASIALLADDGCFLEIGKADLWSDAQFQEKRPAGRYEVLDMGAHIDREPSLAVSMFDSLLPGFESGELKPLPKHRFPAHRAQDAFRHMAMARHTGKVVITQPCENFAPPLQDALRPDHSYLLTGGLGGLGLLFADWLVEQGARHLALVGRSKPNATAKRAIEALESRGVTVQTFAVDVADEAQMKSVLESVRAKAPIAGIVHGAGTLDDGVLLQQSLERLETVAKSKVNGSWILHRESLSDSLDFFVLFSTLAAVLGSPGQGNHSAVNMFMDRLAAHRRLQGRPALSINWGAWSGVGAAAERDVLDRVAATGILAIDPDQGVEAFRRLLLGAWNDLDPASANVGVTGMNWNRYLAPFGEQVPSQLAQIAANRVEQSGAGEDSLPADQIVAALGEADAIDRQEMMISFLGQQVALSLGLDPSQALDPTQPLSELGLDSLLAVEMRSQLGQQLSLERSLPATLLFDYPSLEKLADYLLDSVLQLSTETSSEVETDLEVDSDLDDLSEEEAEALLLQELGKQKDV